MARSDRAAGVAIEPSPGCGWLRCTAEGRARSNLAPGASVHRHRPGCRARRARRRTSTWRPAASDNRTMADLDCGAGRGGRAGSCAEGLGRSRLDDRGSRPRRMPVAPSMRGGSRPRGVPHPGGPRANRRTTELRCSRTSRSRDEPKCPGGSRTTASEDRAPAPRATDELAHRSSRRRERGRCDRLSGRGAPGRPVDEDRDPGGRCWRGWRPSRTRRNGGRPRIAVAGRAGIAALEGRMDEALAGMAEAWRRYRDMEADFLFARSVVDALMVLDPRSPAIRSAAAAAREILAGVGARPSWSSTGSTPGSPAGRGPPSASEPKALPGPPPEGGWRLSRSRRM